MNNEQKTPGQIAYETNQNRLGEAVIWEEGTSLKRGRWEAVAQAVLSHALAGAKYVLLEQGCLMQKGDETWSWSLNNWLPAARTTVFKGDICRRPISLPKDAAVPAAQWENLTKGDEFTSSTGMVLQFEEKPVWSLPPAPSGMQWHRDDWKQEMLPDGFRPCLLGEKPSIGVDEFFTGHNWIPVSSSNMGHEVGCKPHQFHVRTRRPLPSPAAPAGGEKNLKDWKSMYHELAASAGDQLAQLRKELEAAQVSLSLYKRDCEEVLKHIGFLNDGECPPDEWGKHVAFAAANRIRSLTTENATLKTELKEARRIAVRAEAEAVENLRSQIQWKPVSTPPTEKDGKVMQFDYGAKGLITPPKVLWCGPDFIMESPWGSPPSSATGWMALSSFPTPLPTPVPTETEEEKMEKEYRDWYLNKYGGAPANDNARRQFDTGLLAWKAAKSTGGPA